VDEKEHIVRGESDPTRSEDVVGDGDVVRLDDGAFSLLEATFGTGEKKNILVSRPWTINQINKLAGR